MDRTQKEWLEMIKRYQGITIYDLPRRPRFSERIKYAQLKKDCENIEGTCFGVLSHTINGFTVGFIYPDWGTNEPRARVIMPDRVYDFLIDE